MNPRLWEAFAAKNQQRVDEDDARAKLARAEAAVARVVLADAAMPDDLRKFAERMLTEGGNSEESQLAFGFRLAVGRAPSSDELNVLRGSLHKYTDRFRQSPATAEEYVSHGEAPRNKSVDVVDLAARTAVASIILNMDETLSQD